MPPTRQPETTSLVGTRHIVAAVVLGACALLCTAAPALPQQQENTLLRRAAASRVKGQEGAAALVFEIADFQCPYCARFANSTLRQLDSAYIRTGKVRWVFVNLPLPNHGNAWHAAEAALCAGGVADRFWAMHDRLFAEQSAWSAAPEPSDLFLDYARELGIPLAPFRACLARDDVAPLIIEDAIFAVRAGVRGTPAFIIDDDRTVVGLKSFEEWRELLEEILRNKAARRR